MDFLNVLLIAIGLAMDAFSVSISAGICIPKPDFGHYFRMAASFGFFQFIMPIIGYFGGRSVASYIQNYDHYIAMALLTFIGVHMIYESFHSDDSCPSDPSRGKTLLILSIATSIDALAVGLSFGVMRKPILVPSIIIGLVCAIFSVAGILLGKRLGSMIGKKGEIMGGIFLILIGIKILVEHLYS